MRETSVQLHAPVLLGVAKAVVTEPVTGSVNSSITLSPRPLTQLVMVPA